MAREEDFRVFLTNTFRKPTPQEVPSDIKEDYEEACKVLPMSNKASAALSRRCLQGSCQGRAIRKEIYRFRLMRYQRARPGQSNSLVVERDCRCDPQLW